MRRITIVGVVLAAMAALLAVIPQSAGAATGSNCYLPGDATLAPVRAAIADQLAAGNITAANAAEVTCDPRLLYTKYLSVSVTEHPAAVQTGPGRSPNSRAPQNCRTSSMWDMNFTQDGIASGGIRSQMYFCYDGYYVNSYTGTCVGYTTGWGNANGWTGSCDVNQWINYTLNGHNNGGVHKLAQGHFVSKVGPFTFHNTVQIDMWGHYDGSCDTKYNNTLRHYC